MAERTIHNRLKIYILVQFFEGKCEAGLHCKQKEECPAFLEQEANLESLTPLTPAWEALVGQLAEKKCGGVENRVCCESFNKPSADGYSTVVL